MIIKPEELKIVYEKEDDGRIRPVYFIDAVKVVRCKDCRRFERNGNKEYGNCAYHLSLAYETDYCSWGERKEAD